MARTSPKSLPSGTLKGPSGLLGYSGITTTENQMSVCIYHSLTTMGPTWKDKHIRRAFNKGPGVGLRVAVTWGPEGKGDACS